MSGVVLDLLTLFLKAHELLIQGNKHELLQIGAVKISKDSNPGILRYEKAICDFVDQKAPDLCPRKATADKAIVFDLRGKSLQTRIERLANAPRRIPQSIIRDRAREIARGVAKYHAINVTLVDLKPANVCDEPLCHAHNLTCHLYRSWIIRSVLSYHSGQTQHNAHV